MFQAKKWSWKRVAANLLLVPVLSGGSVAVVHAQLGRTSGGSDSNSLPSMPPTAPKPAAASQTATTDPKLLLKEGRKALAEGRLADAQDLAQRAAANNPTDKWGLFDDTPAALRKDIDAAKAKANKAQSEQLVKQAKGLAAKPGTDAERAANLDTAIQMARKADQLHGPYSTWDMGDRADKLVKELQEARSKIKVASVKPPAAGPQTAARPNTGVQTAGAQTAQAARPNTGAPAPGATPAAGADAKRAAADKLMAEGRTLASQGNYAGARNKYAEADRVGASFGPGEYSPGFALQELNTRGSAAIDKLVRDSQAFAAQKDYAKADAALSNALKIAMPLGLFPKPITDAQAALYVSSSGKAGVPGKTAPNGITAAGGQEYLVKAPDPVGGTAPVVPAGVQTVYNTKPAAPAGTGPATGRQMLDQAAIELKAGDCESAERMARQAYNLGAQDEARTLLNSIDAERLARKQRGAAEAVKNAKATFGQKDYQRALSVLVMIDPNLLTPEAKGTRDQLLAACKAELGKTGPGDVVATAGTQPEDKSLLPQADPAPNPPGTARVGPDAKTDTSLATQADALRRVEVQKLRSEGLKVQQDAGAAFGRGETDLAMQLLMDYSNRVRSSGLDAAAIAQLLRPVEGRLDTFRIMKGQQDAITRQSKEKRDAREQLATRGAADEERKQEVAALVRRYHDLVKKNDFAAAERVALQAKQLDPDDPAITALAEMAKLQKRVKYAEKAKSDREEMFLNGLNNAEEMGPLVTTEDPVAIQLRSLARARGRGSLDNSHLRTRTPAEFDIELKLDKPISIEFTQTPLDQVIENLKVSTGLPLVIDQRSLADEKISEVQPITVKPGTAVATKNILSFVLDQAGLSYVIEHDMVKVTTIKKSKGRLVTKVFSVADLVTPVPNFALPDYANMDKILMSTPFSKGQVMLQGLNGPTSATPNLPPNGLAGGQGVSNPLPAAALSQNQGMMPGIQGSKWGGGRLDTHPLNASSSMTSDNNTRQEQLIKLITSMVRPYAWDGHGGAGKVEYFDIGNALVVNQTADVIQEVADLLEALRRLQDLAVAVEVRIVSLAESFYERMGVDFSINIQTHNTSLQPFLTSGNFQQSPFINSLNGFTGTVGLTPAGTFTPDLNVPIQSTSFQRAIPGFGNYPNTPGNDGGISLGLAFLNDIQVYTFMEMAQGDQRTNIMQAPKLTLFNGQTATLSVLNTQFFVTDVQVVSVNGQIVFIPNNQALPGPGSFNQGGSTTISIQAVVSADRRFVRLNLPVNLGVQSGASVPLFPVTTFVTPVFEGGSQGQPIPFTQFLQQPSFTVMNIQTTVVCPDGGTVLLGGLKTLREGRNEFGPPFLSKIPYLSRLFKNVGVGRDTTHVMIMVTPRIIINAEEEIVQTEGGQRP